MHPLSILVIVICYFGLLLTISYITGKGANNASFFLGNRKSPWYIVAFGMIGASLSGVTFISVPGWVGTSSFSYMQMVIGYLFGYFFIANVLMPIYYKLNLTSIYAYLEERFGFWSYKTGAFFFLLSRTIGAAFRLFLVAGVLQITIFSVLKVPFEITVIITILLIWLYTFRGGIKTIIWTDTLQTTFMLLAVCISIILISKDLQLNFTELLTTIKESRYSRIFFFDDWTDKKHFVKQFLSGAFIAIVMTGLDQDMMQKNLSCVNIRDAKKNMHWFSIILIPVNLLFLSLGALLLIFVEKNGISIPAQSDDLFPVIATGGYLLPVVAIFFMIGIIAAAYSSADSALTALTTSFTVDMMPIKKMNEDQIRKLRKKVHLGFSILLFILIIIFKAINDKNVISAIFTVAGYTYGPLLGLYTFGLFTKYKVKDRLVPVVAVISPLLCLLINYYSEVWLGGYKFGFELLILNGLLTFTGLFIIKQSVRAQKEPHLNSL